MSSILKLQMHRDLYQFHADKMQSCIEKIRQQCDHEWHLRRENVSLEEWHGFFFTRKTYTCLKCGASKHDLC